ncbi:hypothetical protein VTI28DRAFT_10435 [Corynascus sepedonium]
MTGVSFLTSHLNDDLRAPGTSEPAVFRLPRPSPEQRFAWRNKAADSQVIIQGKVKSISCPFPDCVREVEEGGATGDGRSKPITNSMMKAYVAMRAGLSSVVASEAEPLLTCCLLHQGPDRKVGAHRFMHDIQESMSAISPDNHNRRNAYYVNRNCSEFHVPIPDGYDEPLVMDIIIPRLRTAAYPSDNPCSDDDESWISDDEGHPEMSRITPCTFARWAADCARDDGARLKRHRREQQQQQQEVPAIPARSSSLRCCCELETLPSPRTRGRYDDASPMSPFHHREQTTDLCPRSPPWVLVPGIDTTEVVNELGTLRGTLAQLVREKQQLRSDIEVLRREKEELEANARGGLP